MENVYVWDQTGFSSLNLQTLEFELLELSLPCEPLAHSCYIYSPVALYIAGGRNFSTSARVFSFNGTVFSETKSMLQSRADACGVWQEGNLYLIGGYNQESDQSLGSCERFNLEADRWMMIPQLKYERRSASACVFGDRIYVFGGVGPIQIEFLSIPDLTWKTIDICLQTPISELATFALDDFTVLLMGGRNEDESLSRAVTRIDLEGEALFTDRPLDRGFAVTQPCMSLKKVIYLTSGQDILAYAMNPIIRRIHRVNTAVTSTQTEPVKTAVHMDSPIISQENMEDGVMEFGQSSITITITLPVKSMLFVVKRPGTDDDVDVFYREVVDDLLERGVKVVVEEHSQAGLDSRVKVFDLNKHKKKINLIVTLGGDGTVIWAVSLFKTEPIPTILAVTMGSLGFMTYYTVAEAKEILHRVVSRQETVVDLKKRLDCWLQFNGVRTHIGRALNEVVIDRGSSPSLLQINCYMNDELFTVAYADGVMVATPAGSTAYSLAAGGSIVHHDIPSMLFTPICPHSLSFRPILFPEKVKLSFQVPQDARCAGWVSLDGCCRYKLPRGAMLDITTSNYPVPFISQDKGISHWMLQLKSIMKWNKRKKQKPLRSEPCLSAAESDPPSNGSVD